MVQALRQIDPETGEVSESDIVVFDPALLAAPLPEDYAGPQGIASLDDVDGLTPDLAIKTSLKERVGEQIVVVKVEFTQAPERFLEEKRKRGLTPDERIAVVTWRSLLNGYYYVAVGGNRRLLQQCETLERMLFRCEGVRGTIISFETQAGTAYAFGPVNQAK